MSYLLLGASPSDVAASGLLDELRYREIHAVQETALAVVFYRVKMTTTGRIIGVDSWLRTGGGNASAARVLLNGTTILDANLAWDGLANGVAVTGVLEPDHASYDTATPGIRFVPGDVLTFERVTAGAGSLGLNITVRTLI